MRRSPARRVTLFVVSLALLASDAAATKLPGPKQRNSSGIDHIVVVTMENRSFDHFLGWHPTADGQQACLTDLDESGVLVPTAPLAPLALLPAAALASP